MINKLIEEIRYCLDNECFFAALVSALTLPDVCGKAEYPDKGNAFRYIRWFNKYIGAYETVPGQSDDEMPYCSGELIYNLRNSLLHQATPNIDSSKVKEERCKVNSFILTISSECDGGTSVVAYGKEYCLVGRRLEVNIINLCKKICAVSERYYSDNRDKFSFIQYEIKDIRYRTEQTYGADD